MAVATGTALAIAGGASLAGGVGNYIANKSAADRAEMLNNEALRKWLALQVPDPEAQKLVLQKFVQEGTLDPKLEHAINANPSEFEKITTNAKYSEAQNRALDELENIGYEGGLRLQDKAAIQDATLEGQVKERANREAIAADMARRGLGGSGFEVAAQLQGQQGNADRDANSRLKIAAMAQDRALQAIEGSGDLAGKYRGQDFSEKSAKASAADRINMFNTTNLQDVQGRNIASQNRAAEMNLAQKQKTGDQNIAAANYEQEYNKKLMQQQFENEAKKTAGMTGQYGNAANLAQQQGVNQGNLYSNMGAGVAGAATSAAQLDFWDKYFNKQKSGSTPASGGP